MKNKRGIQKYKYPYNIGNPGGNYGGHDPEYNAKTLVDRTVAGPKKKKAKA